MTKYYGGAIFHNELSMARTFDLKIQAEKEMSYLKSLGIVTDRMEVKELDGVWLLTRLEPSWKVVVGNLGNIECTDEENAAYVYTDYVQQSKGGKGRVGGENVTLFHGDEIIDEYLPEDD